MSDVTKNSFTDLLATLLSPVNIKFAVMLARDVVVANACSYHETKQQQAIASFLVHDLPNVQPTV